mmetsp:Transcript_13628/g.38692  ORF Transcript_13628/g.38692 Transcript_13628/m.38692 type:complete len:174 (+) Transcript_13628:207-728(+)
MDAAARRAMFQTSNSKYGWRPAATSVEPIKAIAAVRQREGESEEDRRFKEAFWRSTSSEYGGFGFNKNALCTAVDELKEVSRAKHVLPHERGPAAPKSHSRSVNVSFSSYQHEDVRKVEHKIYTTSANEIGSRKPHFGNKLFPHSNDFTKTFLAGPQRDCSLNTTISKNRYVD